VKQRGWGPADLAGEALANLAARPWTALLAFLLTVGLCLAASSAELFEAKSISVTSSRLIAEGYTTLKVTPAQPDAGIPAASCAALEGQDGVVAAGGVGTPEAVETASNPGDGFAEAPSVGDITAVLTGIAAPPSRTTGLVISSDLASELGVAVGSHLDIAGVTAPIGVVAPLGARDEFLGRIVLDPVAPVGQIVACYVQFAPADFDEGVNAVSAVFSSSPNLTYEALVPHGAGTVDPASSFADRESQYGWEMAGAVLGLILFLLARQRRHEMAVYLITGATRAEVALLVLIESEIILFLGLVSAALWCAVAARGIATTWEVFRLGEIAAVRAGLLAACLLPLALIWLLRADLTKTLRERNS
jgi:hypothetical protein